jgi:PAS domain S-box-containing protein
MNRFEISKNTSILIVSFCSLIALFLVFGIYALDAIQKISALTHIIYEHPLVVSNAALQANVSVTKMHRNMKDVVLFKSPERIQEAIVAVNKQEERVYQLFDLINQKILGDEGYELAKETRTLFQNWKPIRDEVIGLVENGQHKAAAEITIGKGAQHVNKLDKKMIALTKYARNKATGFSKKAEQSKSRIYTIASTLLSLGIFTSLIIAIYAFKKISSSNRQLRDAELQFRSLAENAPDSIFIQVNGIFAYVNHAGVRLLEAKSEFDIIGKPVFSFVHPKDHHIVKERIRMINEEYKQVETIIETFVSRNNKFIPVEVAAVPFKYNGKSGSLAFVRDVRRRMEAQISLKQSEKRFRRAIEDAPFPNMIHSENGRVLEINRAWKDIAGYSLTEIPTLNDWIQKAHSEQSEDIKGIISGSYEWNDAKSEGVYKIICKDGSHRIWRISSTPLGSLPDGQRIAISMAADITDILQAHQHIEHLNNVLRAIRDVIQLIVHVRNSDDLIRKGCSLLVDSHGYIFALIVLTDNENKPVSWSAFGMPDYAKKLRKLFSEGKLPPCCVSENFIESSILNKPDQSICSECIGRTIKEDQCVQSLSIRLVHNKNDFGCLIVALDKEISLSDEEFSLLKEMAEDLAYALNTIKLAEYQKEADENQIEMEKQLIQAQKMESIGRLAGGVAHDYNNMLSVIQGFAELAVEKSDPSSNIGEDLKEILTAAKRSADITRQLLAFSRQQTVSPKILDLNKTVEGMLKMLRRLIGEDIDLAWHPKNNVWSIKIDPTQIDQILVNLCVNARDAIKDVGKITIETGTMVFDKSYCDDHIGFIPGEFSMLAVSDDGFGMDKQTIDKIFEPFFTTKSLGMGTGLGLATIYGIVKQNNGFINVYSEPGKGSTFRIYFPRYEGHITGERLQVTIQLSKSMVETVLVVEDEDLILTLAKEMLTRLGYQPLVARTPLEALKIAKEHIGEISLLITDIVMPEMNGKVLAERLQAKYPGLKCLFMSGYTANIIAHRGILEEGVHFIQKPFSIEKLSQKVRIAIDS